jgi:hypothetical protein
MQQRVGRTMNIKVQVAAATAAVLNVALGAVGRNFRTDVVGRLRPEIARGPASEIELLSPRQLPADPSDLPTVERIVAAYRRAKADQIAAPAVYRPSSLWQHHLDTAFAELGHGDITAAAKFLTNFAAWPIDTGIEGSAALFYAWGNDDEGRARLRGLFDVILRYWREHEACGRSLDALTYPRFGNQCGVLVDGDFVGLGAAFADVHASVLRDVLGDIHRPVVAEIGGGWAKVFYFLTRKLATDWCYVDLDLPEPLCCAAYYYMKAFPEKKVLLYGEGNLTTTSLRAYDLFFLPSFAIEALPDESVDLFMNKNSLGEMLPDTAHNFVGHIARATRGWFWHLNHEFVRNRFEDGSESLICREYELPPERFRRIHRYFDLGHAFGAHGQGARLDSDIYGYLYQRKA